MELNATAQTNDRVNVSGTLNLGGTLFVSNLNGVLAPGQTYQLFNATSFVGSFSTLNLPVLSAGLTWDTSTLVSNGSLSLMALPETLSVTNSASGQMQLSWIYGTLQSATNAAGPYCGE